jgi:hypothetical protein
MTHQGAIYGSDQEFLAMALPFIEAGLAAGEPVLAATTAANIELLCDALGERADDIDHAETAYFGRRPPQRVAAFHRYWRHAAAKSAHGHVRIIAEPVWQGRSTRDVLAWQRMESALNLVLADTNIWMICPYDTRVVPDAIIEGAHQTHPQCVRGERALDSDGYQDPMAFTAACDSVPLPEPPEHAATAVFGADDLTALRRYLIALAAEHGLPAGQGEVLVSATHESLVFLASRGTGPATVRVWMRAGVLLCQVDQPGASVGDPVVGLRPPLTRPRDGDGLWLARQICEHLDIRSTPEAASIRMHLPTRRSAELLQAPAAIH